MAGPHAHPRNPLSPVRANGPAPTLSGSKGGFGSLDGGDDVFAESVTKPQAGPRASRIPRATPSPDPRRPAAPGATPSLSSAGQPSRIPRPGSAAPQGPAPEGPAPLAPRPGSAALLSGFHRYSNPSFAEQPEEHPTPAIAQPVHPAGMATPEAVQLLQRVGAAGGGGADAAGQQAGRVGDIVDSYLRTGPQKLSPEPQKDYCIAAPKPGAVAAAGRRASAASASGSAASGSAARNGAPVVAAPAAPPSPPEVAAAAAAPSPAPPTPASVCSNVPDDVFADLMDDEAAGMLEDGEEDDLEAIFGPAPTLPAAGPEVRLAAPVDSAGHAGAPTAAGMGLPSAGKAMAQAAARPASPSLVAGIAPHSAAARRPARVTFALPSPPSAGSFSFGMGASAAAAGRTAADPDPGSPTPEPQLGAQSARKARPGSADSVDQPNPFSSMLHHLQEGGPGVCVSPHPRGRQAAAAAAAAAPIEGFALKDPPPALAPPPQAAHDSPRSPSNQTPLRLLPEGVPPSATPELGRGDLSAWVARRGMAGLLSSPAAADLRRMWDAMRAGGAAAAEADALRAELAAARAELARREADHAQALGAAQAGQQWAEAEVRRAQEAAQHMMALADQIQATFATCEEEKAALAEELEEAWRRAAAAEAAAAAAGNGRRAELHRELATARGAARRAAAEAEEAREVALRSAEELEAIKATLAEARRAMASAPPPGELGPEDEGCATPFSKLKAQLQHAADALTALHASGRQQSGGAGASPALDRLTAASAAGLTRAQALLAGEGGGAADDLSTADNGELRELLSGVQARIMALSPPRPSAAAHAGAERRATSPPPAGTVTVDFRELRCVLAEATGQAVPPSPAPAAGAAAGPASCEVEVDGVRVTNVPPAAMSQVRSMVEFFEEMAGGGAGAPTPSPAAGPPASPQEASLADGWGAAASPVNGTFSGGAEGDEAEGPGPSVWTPVPATAERLRAFLPPRAGATPAGYAPTPGEGAAAPRAGPPAAPAATPVDDATPRPQRRHLQALDALEALQAAQQAEEDDEEEFDEDFGDDFVNGEASFVADSGELSAHSVGPASPPGPPASAPLEEQLWALVPAAPAALSPSPSLDLAAVDSAAPGTGLRQEVRARLNRLKEELRAAQSKLNHVDAGLAAIATPGPAPAALPAPPAAPQATPAAAGPTPRTARPTTRPSVRFADSVKPGSEEAPRRLPRTPGVSTGGSVYATAPELSPEPMVASSKTMAAAALQEHSPDSSFAIAAVGGGLRSPAAAAAAAELAAAFVATGPTPLRRLNLDSDSSDDEEAVPAPRTAGSARSRVATLGGGRLAGLTPAASSRTPLARPELYAGYGSSATPLLTRFSSASSSVGSPAGAPAADPAAALLGLRPAVVGRARRAGGAGGKRVSDSEEREFRRRAAALKIHVSPYFKRGGGRGARAGEVDPAVTVE